MNKTIRVDVTPDDIEQGQRLTKFSCPVALAMTRALGMPVSITRARWDGHWVGAAEFPILIGDQRVVVRLSRRVGQFVHDFDAGRHVAPFSFRTWR